MAFTTFLSLFGLLIGIISTTRAFQSFQVGQHPVWAAEKSIAAAWPALTNKQQETQCFMSESSEDEEDPLAALRKKREAILNKNKKNKKTSPGGEGGAEGDFSANLLKHLETVESSEDAVQKAKAKIESLQQKEQAAKKQQQAQNSPSPSSSSAPRTAGKSSSSSPSGYGSGVRVPEMAGVTPSGTQSEQQRAKPQKSTAARVQTEVQLPVDENNLHIPNRLGFGTMAWGDTSRGFTTKRKVSKKMAKGGKFNAGDTVSAYNALMEGGVTFVETSESYGKALRPEGLSSEQLIAMASEQGLAVHTVDATPVLAGTFNPPVLSPLRFGSSAVVRAIQQTCERMEVSSLDLYQVDVLHPLLYVGGGRSLAKGLATAVDLGLCNYVGVCNFGSGQLKSLCNKLEKRGIQLATNQVRNTIRVFLAAEVTLLQ
jgi:diketogulonate reductase-like aldo/keto reductase